MKQSISTLNPFEHLGCKCKPQYLDKAASQEPYKTSIKDERIFFSFFFLSWTGTRHPTSKTKNYGNLRTRRAEIYVFSQSQLLSDPMREVCATLTTKKAHMEIDTLLPKSPQKGSRALPPSFFPLLLGLLPPVCNNIYHRLERTTSVLMLILVDGDEKEQLTG